MTDPIIDFLDQHSCGRRAYLGDGLYAGWDGEYVWLATAREARAPGSGTIVHHIALEPSVRAALAAYLKNTKGSTTDFGVREVRPNEGDE